MDAERLTELRALCGEGEGVNSLYESELAWLLKRARVADLLEQAKEVSVRFEEGLRNEDGTYGR